MTMKAATVEILIEKAHFEPRVAVAVAEAMDEAIDAKIRDAQPVTVPILDARFTASEARVDARFTASEARVDARFAASEAKIDARFAASEAKIDARFTASEARVDARFTASEARVDARFTASEAKIDARFAAFKSELLTHLYGAILAQFAVLLALAYFFVSHLKSGV
jgi:hypothetical protein